MVHGDCRFTMPSGLAAVLVLAARDERRPANAVFRAARHHGRLCCCFTACMSSSETELLTCFLERSGSGSGMFYIRGRPSTAIGCGMKP
jgi:hypothetical protein